MDKKIILYHAPNTRSDMVLWGLLESQLKFDYVMINREAKEHKSPEYLKINPFGLVPAMQIDGQFVIESLAMLLTIGDLSKEPLAPKIKSPQRASYNQWLLFHAASFSPSLVNLIMKRPLDYDWRTILDFITKALRDHRAINGNQFTMADIAFITGLGWAKAQGLIPTEYREIALYIKDGFARPAALEMRKINKEYLSSLES